MEETAPPAVDQLFALPPAEPVAHKNDFLRRELASLKVRTWILLLCTIGLGCLLFVGGPSARPQLGGTARPAEPSRALKAAPSSVVTLVEFAPPVPAQKEAAEFLIGGHTAEALVAYRKLLAAAPGDAAYRAIVRQLERKLRCDPGDVRCAH